MRSQDQFDTGVDAGRHGTALMKAEPTGPGRLRLLTLAAGGLAAVLIAAFAALTIYAYTANVSVVSAASPCPAVNDWCTTMTVADAEGDGLLHGYEFDKFGSIVDDTIQPGGANINVWTVHTFAHPHPQLPDYIFFGSNPRVPRGTQVTIEGHTFIADAESHDGEEGDTGDKWEFPSGELPASLVWSAGQEVTVSVKLASPCDNLDNLVNAIVVKNLTGEITQAGDTNLHKIRLDPYKSYLIEAIGQDGQDMLGVEEHPTSPCPTPTSPPSGTPGPPPGGLPTVTAMTVTRPKTSSGASCEPTTGPTRSRSPQATTAPAPTSSRSGSTTSAGSTTTATYSTSGQEAPRDTPRAPTCPPEPADVRCCWPVPTGATTT